MRKESHMTSTQTLQQEFQPAPMPSIPSTRPSPSQITHNGVATFRSGFERYEAKLSGGEQPRLKGTVDVTSVEIDEEQPEGAPPLPRLLRCRALPRVALHLNRAQRRRRRQCSPVLGELEIRARSARSRPAAASARSAPTSAVAPASGSRSRPPSTAATSASTGNAGAVAERRRGPRLRGQPSR